MGPNREVDLHAVLAFNGRGDVKVLEESNGGAEHRYKLELAGERVVDYTILPEPHTPGILDNYRYYQEDLYIPTGLDPEMILKNPGFIRRFLESKLGPHILLDPMFGLRSLPVPLESNPFQPNSLQFHIHQGVKVALLSGTDIIERLERSEKLLTV
jgi:hypothetical protein